MPPPPEFLDGKGAVRVLKVLPEMEPEHPPEPNCHVAVAAEVIVNLHGVGCCPNPCPQHVQGAQALLEHMVRGHGHGVGD